MTESLSNSAGCNKIFVRGNMEDEIDLIDQSGAGAPQAGITSAKCRCKVFLTTNYSKNSSLNIRIN
jgi:hypothetical protein